MSSCLKNLKKLLAVTRYNFIITQLQKVIIPVKYVHRQTNFLYLSFTIRTLLLQNKKSPAPSVKTTLGPDTQIKILRTFLP